MVKVNLRLRLSRGINLRRVRARHRWMRNPLPLLRNLIPLSRSLPLRLRSLPRLRCSRRRSAASQPAVAQAAPAAGAWSGAVRRACREPAEPCGPAAHLAGRALHAQEEQGGVRGAVPEHEGPLPRGQGPARHRVPRREFFRVQGCAEARRAGSRPDGAHAGMRRGAAVHVRSGPGAEPAASAVAPVAEAAAPAAASSAPVASAAASVQASPTAAQQFISSLPSPAAVPPEPDPAPLDAYDLPPYDDEIVPYDDYDSPAPQSGGAGAAPLRPAPRPALVNAAPSWGSRRRHRPRLPRSPVCRRSPTPARRPRDAMAPVQSPDELEAILAAGFGDGVIVEEVRE